MAQPLRHLAAVRSRLLSSPDLAAIVPAGNIYLSYIFAINQVQYPCIALSQGDGNRGVWVPYVLDPLTMQVDIYAKGDAGQMDVLNISELVDSLLHNQKALTSTNSACFAEIRRTWGNSPQWQDDVDAWRITHKYLIRVFDF
jgi:hypothetical protein